MELEARGERGPGQPELPEELQRKYAALLEDLRARGAVIVAFSGGVDSAFLLKAAAEARDRDVRGILGDSPSVPDEIRQRARRIADAAGVPLEIRDTRELEIPEYAANGPDRCYHCKSELYGLLSRLAQESAGETVLDGTNADDLQDLRPGLRAVRELGVRSPLLELGWTKAEIRQASRWLGLETWDRPASPCLSSRIPHGTPVTVAVLRRIEAAERSLHELGFDEVRVRHHDDLARIEVPLDRIGELIARRDEVLFAVREAGYLQVSVDPAGYRVGGANRTAGTG